MLFFIWSVISLSLLLPGTTEEYTPPTILTTLTHADIEHLPSSTYSTSFTYAHTSTPLPDNVILDETEDDEEDVSEVDQEGETEEGEEDIDDLSKKAKKKAMKDKKKKGKKEKKERKKKDKGEKENGTKKEKKKSKKKGKKNKGKGKKDANLCKAGSFSTKKGCEQCSENTFSGNEDSACTPCPNGLVSAVGSTSEDDCSYDQYPTCNCWTAECGYCSSIDCTVKQDLFNSNNGIEVHSTPGRRRKELDTVILYNEEGEQLGQFQWNVKGIYLSGCVRCQTPPALKEARIKGGLEEPWTFSLAGGVVQIRMGGEVMYTNPLKGECFDRYVKVNRFAFYKMTCGNSFSFIPNEMVAGEQVSSNCPVACLLNQSLS
ncbi:uncharacterized protein LOC134821880 [Bolinopsis microptera]|uniref:uncharacterized protein LOC134821880 n=1 Tax=Bolinopsis microptera TaxID=2820187 RepID=UPI00307AB010